MAISPLAIRIQASGARQTQGEIRQTAGAVDVVAVAGNRAAKSLNQADHEARQLAMSARQVRALEGALDDTGKSAGVATRKIADIADESHKTEKSVRGIAKAAHEGARNFLEMGKNVAHAGAEAHKVFSIWKALKAGSPAKLFDAAVPDAVKRKIGTGMIAGGVGLSALLGTTIAPAMTKEAQLTATSALAGDDAVGKEIYKAADDYSVVSVANLPELVDAAKTLTKDKQFSVRMLRAADDLAATDPDQFKPQDAARALGRVRVGDTGEGLERLNDMGLSKLDLKSKGIKFDESGAVADKTPEGITKLMDAIVATIEERFGGLSERLATTTLTGAVSNMQDALGRFATSIGETFIPAINWGAQTIGAMATWLNELPEPMKKAIAWGAAVGAGLLIFGGTLLIVGGTISKVIFAYKALNFILGICGTSVGKLALQMLTKLIPSLVTAGLAIGLIALIAAAAYVGIAGYLDATKKSGAELEAQWPIIGWFWRRVGDALFDFMNHPLWGWIGKVLDPFNRLGLQDASKNAGNEAEAESLRLTNESRKRRGLAPLKSQAGHEDDDDRNETAQSVRDRWAKEKGSGSNALADWQTKNAASFNSGSAAQAQLASMAGVSVPSGPLMVGMAEQQLRGQQSEEIQAKMAEIDTIQSEIFALRDSLRTATKEQKPLIQEQIIQKQRQLSAMKKDLSAMKTLSKQAERDAKLAEKGVNSAAKYGEVGKYDAQIEVLRDQLTNAQEVGDANQVFTLTTQIETLRARDKYDRAMLAAAQTENATQRKAMEAAAKRDFDADKMMAGRLGRKAVEPLDKIRERDARMLAKVDSDAVFQDKIFDLEEQLEAAKEEKNASQVRALTLQIAKLKAQAQYEEDLINARDEMNVGHRETLEKTARKNLDIANRRALRDANIAMMRTEKEGKSGKKNLSDSAIRAQMAMMRGNSLFAGGPALGSGINYGDRFAEADALRTRYENSPLRSFQSYNRMDVPQMDIGALKVPEVAGAKRGGKVKVKSRNQNSSGDWIFKFEDLVIPYMGLSEAGD